MRFDCFEKEIQYINFNFSIKEFRDGLTYEILKKDYSWIFDDEFCWMDAILGTEIMNDTLLLKWYSGQWISGNPQNCCFVHPDGTRTLYYTLKVDLNNYSHLKLSKTNEFRRTI